LKKLNRKKKSIKPIKILKKLTGSVWFWFYKPETENIEANRNQNEKNPEKNRVKPEKLSQTDLNRFLS
jgi:hypothetical protein